MRPKKSFITNIMCVLIAFGLTVSTLGTEKSRASFDGEILRFHVIANSNSPEDQALKLKVRDSVLAAFRNISKGAENAAEAEKEAIRNLSYIREIAIDTVSLAGYDYDISVNCGVYPFPKKSYGNITLPAGNYKAVRIVIGEGEGKNWWCVMYPPLCFVDETTEFDEKALASLSEETRKKITEGPNIRFRFALPDLIKKLI